MMQLEINEKFVRNKDILTNGKTTIAITPSVGEEYWVFRVKLYRDQALLAFPKFFTIGIGFTKEKDWNSNLPYKTDAKEIYNHIRHNKKYKKITDEDCIEAIKLLQEAAAKYDAQASVKREVESAPTKSISPD